MGSNNKNGSGYSTTTVYNMKWLSKKNKNSLIDENNKISNSNSYVKSKSKSTKKEKPVLYPVFERCSQISDDSYWQTIFSDCARGKFPRYFYYQNGLITWRKGNKIDRVLVSEDPTTDDIYDVYNISTDFFRAKAGMYSVADKERMKKEEERLLSEKKCKDFIWSNINKKKVKDLLITDYVASLSRDYNLSETEKTDLITTIKSGFLLKYFKNVEMEDGRITDIEGLVWNDDKERFEIETRYKKKKSFKRNYGLGIEIEDKQPPVDFIKEWEKYLETLEKTKKLKQRIGTSKSRESEVYKSVTRSDSS